MKCVYTFGTGRHKRQADITLLFQYISSMLAYAGIELKKQRKPLSERIQSVC